jgi:hypothetical protein
VVGSFPSWQALLRLSNALLEEQNEEWAVGRRSFGPESMNTRSEPTQEEVVGQAPPELQSAERIGRAMRPDLHHLTRRDLPWLPVLLGRKLPSLTGREEWNRDPTSIGCRSIDVGHPGRFKASATPSQTLRFA